MTYEQQRAFNRAQTRAEFELVIVCLSACAGFVVSWLIWGS